MTAGPVGLVVGTVLGIASYRALQMLKLRVEKEETRKVLQLVSLIDLCSFPIIGYLVGAYVFSG
jgi:hypothetical protein